MKSKIGNSTPKSVRETEKIPQNWDYCSNWDEKTDLCVEFVPTKRSACRPIRNHGVASVLPRRLDCCCEWDGHGQQGISMRQPKSICPLSTSIFLSLMILGEARMGAWNDWSARILSENKIRMQGQGDQVEVSS